MSAITLSAVSKRFGETLAVDAASLEIARGELVALLGASGCGKTTLLRMIAGFETVSAGSIAFDGTVVAGEETHLPPEDRHVAIVFQSYALWPHMSVAENVGYPLRVRGVAAAKRRTRVREALASVDMTAFEDRRPAELSGGQRQRVALARCLTMDPSIVLLDEPLANLDVHLRAAMEDVFRSFHERTGATMIYVTHDQAEAMAMADRIAVMEKGRILQVADPVTLYREPASPEVARFIGQGRVVTCRALGPTGDGRREIDLFDARFMVRAGEVNGEAGRVCFRPEDLAISSNGGFAARVVKSTYKGGYALVEITPEAAPETVLVAQAERLVPKGESVRVAVKDGWLLGG
jgi:iron(III) transport system ATP-binding protein